MRLKQLFWTNLQPLQPTWKTVPSVALLKTHNLWKKAWRHQCLLFPVHKSSNWEHYFVLTNLVLGC